MCQYNAFRQGVVFMLCLSLAMPGCRRRQNSGPNPDTTPAPELRFVLNDLENELKTLRDEANKSKGSEKDALNPPIEPNTISGYKALKEAFEQKNEKLLAQLGLATFEDFVGWAKEQIRQFETTDLVVPTSQQEQAAREFLAALQQEIENQSPHKTVAEQLKTSADAVLAKSKEAKNLAQQLRSQFEPVVAAFTSCISKIDGLPKDKVAEPATVQALNEEFSNVCVKIKDLSTGEFEKNSKEFKQALDQLKSLNDRLKEQLANAEKAKSLPQDVIDKGNQLREKTDATLQDFANAASAMGGIATAIKGLAPVIAANPWAAVAVFAVMILMMIFLKGGGGGSSGGTGTAKGGQDGKSEQKGDKNKGKPVEENSGLKPNEGKPSNLGNDYQGDIKYQASWLGEGDAARLSIRFVAEDVTVVLPVTKVPNAAKAALLELKDGSRNMNVKNASLSDKAQGHFPIAVAISGFDEGQTLRLTWKDKSKPDEVEVTSAP
jgi:ElaB/YqjD/DUF883 family membrane-anchored ribosome-binding protein